MPSVVLGAETPVNIWENRLIFEVYCTEDAAAYFASLLLMVKSREKRGLSVFGTSLAKKHGKKIFTRQFPIFRGVVFALILKSKLALAELDAVQIEINCER
jgi:hypothetical protein